MVYKLLKLVMAIEEMWFTSSGVLVKGTTVFTHTPIPLKGKK